jgi:hypothetical protein
MPSNRAVAPKEASNPVFGVVCFSSLALLNLIPAHSFNPLTPLM